MARYRAGYPGVKDDPQATLNVQFYSNKIPSVPKGDYIDNIHKTWYRRYDVLEANHTYIQWLFPIREPGLNAKAQKLMLHEAEAIAGDPTMSARFLRSYEMMLDFYGMQLLDRATGVVGRNPSNWKQQYSNLIAHPHNNLRITRILKCLGEMGLEHFKKPFLMHVLQEVFVTQELEALESSATNYFMGTLCRDADAQEVEQFVAEMAVAPARLKPSTGPSQGRAQAGTSRER
jgi:hypothetical protein